MCYALDSLFMAIQSDNLGDILDQDQANDIFTIIQYIWAICPFPSNSILLLTLKPLQPWYHWHCKRDIVQAPCFLPGIYQRHWYCCDSGSRHHLHRHWQSLLSICIDQYPFSLWGSDISHTYVANKRNDSFRMLCYHCGFSRNVVDVVDMDKRVVATGYDFTAKTSMRCPLLLNDVRVCVRIAVPSIALVYDRSMTISVCWSSRQGTGFSSAHCLPVVDKGMGNEKERKRVEFQAPTTLRESALSDTTRDLIHRTHAIVAFSPPVTFHIEYNHYAWSTDNHAWHIDNNHFQLNKSSCFPSKWPTWIHIKISKRDSSTLVVVVDIAAAASLFSSSNNQITASFFPWLDNNSHARVYKKQGFHHPQWSHIPFVYLIAYTTKKSPATAIIQADLIPYIIRNIVWDVSYMRYAALHVTKPAWAVIIFWSDKNRRLQNGKPPVKPSLPYHESRILIYFISLSL